MAININNLIKELKSAQKIHLDELKFRIQEQKEVIKEKEIVIKLLTKKKLRKLSTGEFKKAKEILKRWQKVHRLWINLIKKDRRWTKKGGSISWHQKWVKLYQEIINYLSK